MDGNGILENCFNAPDQQDCKSVVELVKISRS